MQDSLQSLYKQKPPGELAAGVNNSTSRCPDDKENFLPGAFSIRHMCLYGFPVATVTNHHYLGDSEQQKFILLWLKGPESTSCLF
jgi:hypothetical protein